MPPQVSAASQRSNTLPRPVAIHLLQACDCHLERHYRELRILHRGQDDSHLLNPVKRSSRSALVDLEDSLAFNAAFA
jgi:hypothetical protein